MRGRELGRGLVLGPLLATGLLDQASGTPQVLLAELVLLVRAAGLVEEAGGKQWTENEAAAQLAAAHRCLAETPMPDDVRAEFAGIAEFITARQW